MLAKILSCAVIGLESQIVEVEADVAQGFPAFNIVGLPDKAVEEAKERVKSALKNCGLKFPSQKRIVINLAPADLKKEGPVYDLPIAVGILVASGQLPIWTEIKDSLFVGELSLNGDLRHTKGILPVAILAKEKGIKALYLPSVNREEARLIKDLNIFPLNSIQELVEHLTGQKIIQPIVGEGLVKEKHSAKFETDFAYIKGQEHIKRALEIAAAGGHNILMSGPPGSGKTLLSRAIPSILPELTAEEVLEVTKIYSVSGLLPPGQPLVLERPFRSPHHTVSGVALVGGGTFPKPGEISLAHRGVLFLDEFPEFPRGVLENLRQPLEDGVVTVSRARGTISFPARFILVASQNPCPCGYYGDPVKDCICTPGQINKYQKKVSGPLLDRIDIHIEVPRVGFEKLTDEQVAESSEEIRKRVQKARDIQEARFKNSKIFTNAEMSAKQIKEFCPVETATLDLLRGAVNQFHLSARAYHHILKVSRTIADLAGSENIETPHAAEALQYRQKMEK